MQLLEGDILRRDSFFSEDFVGNNILGSINNQYLDHVHYTYPVEQYDKQSPQQSLTLGSMKSYCG